MGRKLGGSAPFSLVNLR